MGVYFSLTDPEFHANPYPFYAQLRKQEPVYEISGGGLGIPQTVPSYLVTRYEHVRLVLRDPRFVREEKSAGLYDTSRHATSTLVRFLQSMMLFIDPPNHKRIRTLFSKVFSSIKIERYRPLLEGIASSLLDAALDKGVFDLIEEFARPFPFVALMELFGISHEDRGFLMKVARDIGALLTPTKRNQQAFKDGMHALKEFIAFTSELLHQRSRKPSDDFLTALVQSNSLYKAMSEDEISANILLLLIAGHETTSNLIANGFYTLCSQPTQMSSLERNPALMRTAIDEVLRYESPLQLTIRLASEDVQLGDKTIPKGSVVVAAIGAANRDPEVFPEPDCFDVSRTPNLHLAFGTGIHSCLGAELARIEGEVSLSQLILSRACMTVDLGGATWHTGVSRGLDRIPIRVCNG